MASMQKTFRRLLESGKYSDACVQSNGIAFPVHRNILCFQSNYFANAFSGSFHESFSNTIELEESNPSFVWRMLEYLYSHDYSDECDYDNINAGVSEYDNGTGTNTTIEQGATVRKDGTVDNDTVHPALKDLGDLSSAPARPRSALEDIPIEGEAHDVVPNEVAQGLKNGCWTHSTMYIQGDRFQIPGLKELSLTKFRHSCGENIRLAIKVEVIRQIYTGTPDTDRAMRDAVVDAICQSADQLHGLELFSRALEASPEFSRDLAVALLRKQRWASKQIQWCSQCDVESVGIDAIRRHSIESHLFCLECGEHFPTRKKAMNHARDSH